MRQSELITIGWAYGQAEACLAMAMLGASGIRVMPHSYAMVSVQWDLTHALGGIALQVPAEQAANAAAILSGQSMMGRPGTLWRRLLATVAFIAVFLAFNVPPPAAGFYTVAPSAPRQRSSAADPIPS
ncbi:hypothetical protein [Pelagibius sp. 7325]|uniref:hypothetical protein n=1 Tax=Pelagibius sp. 7325 TaxID=3131994 RepID=UPI0030EE7171